MSKFRVLNAGLAGVQHIDQTFPPDTTSRLPNVGGSIPAVDPYWGGAEFIYAQFSGAVRAKALVQFMPVYDAIARRWQVMAAEAANSGNSGRPVGVAVMPAADGTFGWVQVTGLTPVNSTAAVAANLPVGVAGVGQVGANSAGKQVMGAFTVNQASATITSSKTATGSAYGSNVAGTNQLSVNNTEGWFVGGFVSGTGIAAGAVVTAIDTTEQLVTVSAVHTANVTGPIVFTYNNGAIYFNVVMLDRPQVQGAIT